MTHYLIELAIWMVIAYVLGCLLGWAARNLFAAEPASQPVMTSVVAKPVVMPTPMVARPVVVPPPAAVAPAVPAMETGKMDRPKGIDKARGGKADDLQRISGIGPKNEGILHNLGFFHFDQIAAWTPAQVAWVDDHLRFNGRINREEWIRQASLLAAGKEDEFKRDYGTGGMKNTKGETQSGTRTRK